MNAPHERVDDALYYILSQMDLRADKSVGYSFDSNSQPFMDGVPGWAVTVRPSGVAAARSGSFDKVGEVLQKVADEINRKSGHNKGCVARVMGVYNNSEMRARPNKGVRPPNTLILDLGYFSIPGHLEELESWSKNFTLAPPPVLSRHEQLAQRENSIRVHSRHR